MRPVRVVFVRFSWGQGPDPNNVLRLLQRSLGLLSWFGLSYGAAKVIVLLHVS